MSSYQLVELSIDPEETEPTLEDEFVMTLVGKDLEKLEDPEHLRIASKQLLKIILHKQALIRALCKRLVDLESDDKITKFTLN
tara:strand:- start:270 stop:518 length:249 start_codon:yes stop_codon:yes gene_type:complete